MDKPFIHEDARAEYVESYVWYHERGSHIAEAFEREVEHTIESLQNSPDSWPIYVGRWRRILLRRFPFGIVYGVMERSGRVHLRFFKLTPKTKPEEVTQIRFICEPDEAFGLALMIGQVASSSVPCKEKLSPHKFSSGEQGGETVTTLSVEKWERSGKSGYALTVGRAKDFISVPVPLTKFLFAGEFLRSLATEQSWVERPEKK